MVLLKALGLLCMTKLVLANFFVIDQFDQCEKNQAYPIKFYANIKERKPDGTQIMDMNMTFPMDMDDNTIVKCKVEKKMLNRWVQGMTIEDKAGLCTFMNKYLGVQWQNLQKSMGMTPKVCPIKKGTYHLNNYHWKLEFPMSKGLSIGDIRLTPEVIEKRSGKEMICLRATLAELK